MRITKLVNELYKRTLNKTQYNIFELYDNEYGFYTNFNSPKAYTRYLGSIGGNKTTWYTYKEIKLQLLNMGVKKLWK